MAIRRTIPLIALLIGAFVPSSSLYAQGLILRLPPDGTWSRYRLTYQTSEISILKKPEGLTKELFDKIPKVAFGESELVISSVGTEKIKERHHRWIEIFEKLKNREILLRLLVPEESMTTGGDPFDDAIKVLIQDTDSFGGLHGEITDPNRRAYELGRFRSSFPKFSPDKTGEDAALETDDESDIDNPQRGKVHRFQYKHQFKLQGGTEGMSSHEAKYVVVGTERAPFGVERLWTTEGISVEEDDPNDPAGLSFQSNGTEQVLLIESGKGAVSRFREVADPVAVPGPSERPETNRKSTSPDR